MYRGDFETRPDRHRDASSSDKSELAGISPTREIPCIGEIMEKLSSKKLFIFDLDGTLVDCFRGIEKSLNFTLKKFGYKSVSFIIVKMAVGHGDKNFIQKFFKQEDVEKALKTYRAHHSGVLLKYSRLKSYSKYLLSFLKKSGRIVAIASNRPKHFTKIIIEKLGIDKYLDFVLCADEIRKLKPHPKLLNTIIKRFKVKKEDAIFVGDMDIDLEAARRANMDAIFISGGSSSINDIKKYKNKIIIHSLKNIILMCSGFDARGDRGLELIKH